jgi:acyl-CoA synthetase (AMP-forming)/AMP-acid ligase II
VQPAAGTEPTLAELAAHCKARLAGYKAPKHLVVTQRIVRSPSGKADYRWARDTAEEAIGD